MERLASFLTVLVTHGAQASFASWVFKRFGPASRGPAPGTRPLVTRISNLSLSLSLTLVLGFGLLHLL